MQLLIFTVLGAVFSMIGAACAQSVEQWETPEYLKGGFLPQINAAEAYAQGFTGAGVIVGVIDTGIDARHPEFDGKLVEGYDFENFRPIVPGGNFDQGIHGTHVSGIVGARRNGVEMHGVAFNAAILPIGISFSVASDVSVPEGWRYAFDHSVSIANNSYSLSDCANEGLPCDVTGYTRASFTALYPDIAALMPEVVRHDVLMVFSAANDAQSNPAEIAGAPYLFPEVEGNWLTVASLDSDNTISSYSNRCGVSMMYCLSAPGRAIFSTVPLSADPPAYDRLSGTSMAAPAVAGVAALVKEAYPWFTAHDLQQTLLTTAADIGAPGIDAVYGWGLVNAGKAVRGYGMFVDTAMLDTKGYSSTFANDISGPGGLIKLGKGTLTLSGNSSYQGMSTVREGRLAVDGSITGAVLAENSGVLSGRGSVGSTRIAAGGTVAPGGSIGTLTVNGSYAQEAGGTYAFEFGGMGGDLLLVSGAASLDGTLALLPQDAGFRLGASYEVLRAEGGMTGGFAEVQPASPFLSGQLAYTGDAAELTLVQARSFAAGGQTANQTAVGGALDRSSPTAVQSTALLLPSYAAARDAFDQLSGAGTASVQDLYLQNSLLIRQAATDRLRAAFGAVGASSAPVVAYAPASGPGATEAGMALKAVAAPATTPVTALWATGYGAWTDMDGTANAPGLSSDVGGVLIGADTALAGGWRVGLMGGYGYTSFDADGAGGASGSSDDWTLGAYAGNRWGALGLRTGLAYTWQDVSQSRSVAFGGFADQLKADYDVGTFQAFGELGYTIETGYLSFEPFAGLAYVSLDTDGFDERGGAAALDVQSADMSTTFSTLGVRLAREIAFGSVAATLRGTLAWQHAFGDVTPGFTQAFTGSVPFTVTGVPIAEDAALVEAGLDLSLSAATTLGIAYTGQFGDGTTRNSFNATLKMAF